MSGELFPVESVAMDSPRLAWMKRHGVITYWAPGHSDHGEWLAGVVADGDGKVDASQWFCDEVGECGGSRIGWGHSEDDAVAMLAKKHELRLWNEEQISK